MPASPPAPFDIARIVQDALGGGAIAPGAMDEDGWLQRSLREPDHFHASLFHYYRTLLREPPKSRPPGADAGYDFFNDLVLCQRQNPHPALRWHDPHHGWLALGYRELAAEAGALAAHWAACGVAEGAGLALVMPPGRELLVGLCAALRLGACASLLPPLGPRWLARRLAALAGAHIATERSFLPLLRGFEKQVLPRPSAPGQAGQGAREDSHTYPGEDIALRLFSPLSPGPPHQPVDVAAGTAYLGALRDGLITLGLRPGDELCAPGLHPLQHQPALWLAALASGATYVHLELHEVRERPALLRDLSPRALGVGAALRDLAQRCGKGSLPRPGHWFRNPEEPYDTLAWEACLRDQGLRDVPGSNLVFDAARGGAVLVSPRRRGSGYVSQEVLPAPGLPCALLDANQSGQEAAGGIGLLSYPGPDGKKVLPGHALVARGGDAWTYIGALAEPPRRSGQLYPEEEVCAVAATLPWVRGAAVAQVPGPGPAPRLIQVLLLFTGGAEAPNAEDEVRRQVRVALGEEFWPDRIEVFPLFPRLVKGQVDAAWCRGQFFSGVLHRKAGDPLFRLLTALRQALSSPQAAAGASEEDEP